MTNIVIKILLDCGEQKAFLQESGSDANGVWKCISEPTVWWNDDLVELCNMWWWRYSMVQKRKKHNYHQYITSE